MVSSRGRICSTRILTSAHSILVHRRSGHKRTHRTAKPGKMMSESAHSGISPMLSRHPEESWGGAVLRK